MPAPQVTQRARRALAAGIVHYFIFCASPFSPLVARHAKSWSLPVSTKRAYRLRTLPQGATPPPATNAAGHCIEMSNVEGASLTSAVSPLVVACRYFSGMLGYSFAAGRGSFDDSETWGGGGGFTATMYFPLWA